eukprot:2477601-Pyramimonas_sp.AAC.1
MFITRAPTSSPSMTRTMVPTAFSLEVEQTATVTPAAMASFTSRATPGRNGSVPLSIIFEKRSVFKRCMSFTYDVCSSFVCWQHRAERYGVMAYPCRFMYIARSVYRSKCARCEGDASTTIKLEWHEGVIDYLEGFPGFLIWMVNRPVPAGENSREEICLHPVFAAQALCLLNMIMSDCNCRRGSTCEATSLE